MRENPLYKLLDVRMGGKMVEVFEEEGAKALKTFCRQHFEDEFLYNSGEGEIITHSEYARWRHYQESKNRDRKSTRLNSSHQIISYAVFCLKKKKKN